MFIESAIIGVVVGALGTVAGGLLALLIGNRVKEPRPFLAFAGGMMVAVVFFDMLIESTQLAGVPVMLVGAAGGGIFFAVAAPLFSHEETPSMYAMGLFVLVGIALHNLPEGLAIGSALVENQKMAFSLALLMLVHDVPEGIAVCLPLRLSGLSVGRVFFLAFLTAIPTALGAVLGTAVGAISREMIAGCMAFAGGAMLYISLKELIPAAGKKKALPALLGLCFGFLMTTIV
jgi:ZIP family zinc transporter